MPAGHFARFAGAKSFDRCNCGSAGKRKRQECLGLAMALAHQTFYGSTPPQTTTSFAFGKGLRLK
jgi:hypothetical protein